MQVQNFKDLHFAYKKYSKILSKLHVPLIEYNLTKFSEISCSVNRSLIS